MKHILRRTFLSLVSVGLVSGTLYAINLTSVTTQTVSAPWSVDAGWYQQVNDKLVNIVANFVSSPDGDRNAGTKLPTTSPNAVRFDFVNASTANGGGNYAGVMTYAPWVGTTASTGDASYQLAFNSTATNGGGIPYLSLRKGIDSTWNSWYTLLHSGNYISNGILDIPTNQVITGTKYFLSNKGATSTVGSGSTYALEAYSTDLGAAGMSFHRGGAYAVNMGLDPDNVLRIGGWSAAANRWQLDMSGNNTIAGGLTLGGGITDSAGARMDAAGGWLRTYGNTGWYNGTYGGGMYMIDATWVRTYNNKSIWTNNLLGSDAGLTVGYAGTTPPVNGAVFSGSVGIGTSSPGYKLDVNGDVRATTYLYTSDIRLKKDIATIENAPELLDMLRGVSFAWKSDSQKTYGFIAQEVEKILPELVHTDALGYKSVEYANIVPLLVEAYKTEKQKSDAQGAKILELEKRLERLEQKQ